MALSRKAKRVKFMSTGKQYDADEIGVNLIKQNPTKEIKTGDVGYIISGIKDAKEVKVGDTITAVESPADSAIEGFEEVKPMVFAGIYPVDTEEFEELRASLKSCS
jgi:GTP-binding protein LepA